MYPGMSMDMSWMGLASLAWLVLTVAAVAAAVWLVATFARGDDRARRTLDDRLARGEIDVDEYRSRRAVLRG